MMSDFDNMDVMTENENINPIERDFPNTIERSANHFDTDSNSHPRENSAQGNEFRVFGNENAIPGQKRFLECIKNFHK